MWRKSLAFSLVSLLAVPTAPAAELPVRKVVLYKHGIGFFERSGRLAAGEAARLEFRTGDMNDVLKSLTIEERGGGRVSGVRYDSSEPLERKLAEFPFRVGGAQPLAAVLDQLKGARVELRFGADRVEGAIVAARTVAATERHPEKQEIVLLLDSGDVRALDLLAAAAVRFPDPKLQAQFRDYLAALIQSRDRDKRGVTIESSGAGPRDLLASYVIPTPAWKSSYRLVLDSGPEPLLEGWAIVDNTTGEDWSGVTLSLVSGLPVSFVSRLYEPRYVSRPEAELPQDRAQRPILHAGAVEMAESKAAAEKPADGVRPGNQPAAQRLLAPLAEGGIAGIAGNRRLADREIKKEIEELERQEFRSEERRVGKECRL